MIVGPRSTSCVDRGRRPRQGRRRWGSSVSRAGDRAVQACPAAPEQELGAVDGAPRTGTRSRRRRYSVAPGVPRGGRNSRPGSGGRLPRAPARSRRTLARVWISAPPSSAAQGSTRSRVFFACRWAAEAAVARTSHTFQSRSRAEGGRIGASRWLRVRAVRAWEERLRNRRDLQHEGGQVVAGVQPLRGRSPGQCSSKTSAGARRWTFA